MSRSGAPRKGATPPPRSRSFTGRFAVGADQTQNELVGGNPWDKDNEPISRHSEEVAKDKEPKQRRKGGMLEEGEHPTENAQNPMGPEEGR